MIEFNGTVKEFLKNYPKEERKVGETYRIITTKGSNDYQFVGSVSEKNFKRIENNSTVDNEIDGAELERQYEERQLSELKRLAKKILAAEPTYERDLNSMCKKVWACTKVADLACIENVATVNRLMGRNVYVRNQEVYWEVKNKKNIVDDIDDFINKLAQTIRLQSIDDKESALWSKLLEQEDADNFARFCDEWRQKCHGIMKYCKQSCGFDLKKVIRLNKLIHHLSNIEDGLLEDLNEIVDDYTWFGETFKTYSRDIDEDGHFDPIVHNTEKEFKDLNRYLIKLFVNYGELDK